MKAIRDLLRLLIVATASVCVSAQQGSLGCTNRSFIIPSWLVQDVTRTAPDGVLAFNLVNRATNYIASVACKGAAATEAKAGRYECAVVKSSSAEDELEAAVELSPESGKGLTYHVEHTWKCDDRGKLLTFTAVGTATAPSPTYSSPLLIRANLTSPVSITPAYSDGPVGHDSPGCTSRSTTSPGWVLSGIHYVDEPADGIEVAPFRNFVLVIDNAVTGYQASCNMGRGAVENGIATLSCNGEEFQSSNVGNYPVVTQAWFDVEEYALVVNQTWYCDDEDPAKPLQITASGRTALALTCQSITSELTGLINRYCASSGTVSLPGTLAGEVVTLEPYAIEDPVLRETTGDACTLASIFNPEWRFSHIALLGETQDKLYFEVILTAPDRRYQYPIAVNQGRPVAGAEGWYECVVGESGNIAPPLWPYWCQFRFDRVTKELEMKAKWKCQELDKAHPVHFSGESTAVVDSEFSCETLYDGLVWCATEDPGYTVTAPVVHVTWGPE